VAAVLAVGVLAAGCSGGGDDDGVGLGDGGEAPPLGADPSVDGGDTGGGNDDAGAASGLPDDVCTLLSADEVARLVPGATVKGPENVSAGGISTAGCSWDNDTTNLSLNLNSGVPAEQLKLQMETSVEDYQGDLIEVAGDDAAVWSMIAASLDVYVLHDGVMMSLGLIRTGAPDERDTMVDLAAAAVGRL
jgi:hypothetical protein